MPIETTFTPIGKQPSIALRSRWPSSNVQAGWWLPPDI